VLINLEQGFTPSTKKEFTSEGAASAAPSARPSAAPRMSNADSYANGGSADSDALRKENESLKSQVAGIEELRKEISSLKEAAASVAQLRKEVEALTSQLAAKDARIHDLEEQLQKVSVNGIDGGAVSNKMEV
jgi:uncharacterized phage infection (PIP) family protein YhgE